MPTKQVMHECKNCQRHTMHLEQKPNHILHLLMSVFTIGLWVIVWLMVSIGGSAPQCTVCGKKRGAFGLT